MRLRALLSSAADRDSRAILLALALLLLAFAMPPVRLPQNTYEYVIVFDITQSMDVEDYELEGVPVSRLTYARESVRRALRELPCGSRVGWGAFAEYRTLLLVAPVEVCEHYNDLLASLDNIDGRMRWSNASEVTKAVYWAMRAAKEIPSTPDVIFLTDGHEAPPLNPEYPLPMFGDLKPGQLRGWLIGTGDYAASPIPRTDDEGNRLGYWRASEVMQRNGTREHLSGLREAHLQSLAQQVGFEYARMTDLASAADAMRDPRFARREPVPVSLFWLPALAAMCVLVLRFRPDQLRRLIRRPLRRFSASSSTAGT